MILDSDQSVFIWSGFSFHALKTKSKVIGSEKKIIDRVWNLTLVVQYSGHTSIFYTINST